MDSNTAHKFVSIFLPEGCLDYFNVTDVKEKDDLFEIHLDEKSTVPSEYESILIKAAGFTQPRVLKDYPIRGKKVNLLVRRRRWLIKTENEGTKKVSRDWNIIEPGTNVTVEFAAFFKAIS